MKKKLKIIQITDTHLFADNQLLHGFDTNQLLLDTLRYIHNFIVEKDFSPDIILLTGDLSHDKTLSSYQFLLCHLEKFNTKIAYIPGNHDDPKNLTEVFEKSPLTFKDKVINLHDSWKLILLNSVNIGKTSGYLPKEELFFFKSILKQSENAKVVIALHHHPILINHYMDKHIVENFHEFQQIIFKFPSIKAVIFGHIHQQYYNKINNIEFYGTPSTCMQLRKSINTKPDDRFSDEKPGFRLITFIGNDIFSDVIRVSVK